MRAVAPRFIACPSDLDRARIVVYGIPFEGRVNPRKGAGDVPAERVYPVGRRTGSREEYERRRPNFYPVLAGHPGEVVRRLLPQLRGHPLYVTIDVDVLDPAEAPGTGSPEPGGLRVPELIEIVRMLGECRTIGGDLVEVAHAWDPTGRTGIAAAWVIREALLTCWGTVRRAARASAR